MKHRMAGKEKLLSFGVHLEVRPPEARAKAKEACDLIQVGTDPSEKKKAIKREAVINYASTFEFVASAPTSKNLGQPRVRAPGGGRKKLANKDSLLLSELDGLVDPASRGDPMSPLRWTCKSTYRLSDELKRRGHQGNRTRTS